MTKQDTKQLMQTEANAIGFEVVYSDLRTGCFHVKQGTVVRKGYIWRNISASDIPAQIKSVAKYGDRLDTMKTSIYFNKG